MESRRIDTPASGDFMPSAKGSAGDFDLLHIFLEGRYGKVWLHLSSKDSPAEGYCVITADQAIELGEALIQFGNGVKASCRFCTHLVDVRPPKSHHWIGGCEFKLKPDTCGKFEDCR